MAASGLAACYVDPNARAANRDVHANARPADGHCDRDGDACFGPNGCSDADLDADGYVDSYRDRDLDCDCHCYGYCDRNGHRDYDAGIRPDGRSRANVDADKHGDGYRERDINLNGDGYFDGEPDIEGHCDSDRDGHGYATADADADSDSHAD